MSKNPEESSAEVDEVVLGTAMPEAFNDFMIGRAQRRRHTVSALELAFREAALGCDHIFEIGANDGRHTRRFLTDSDAVVHAFEPNPYLYKFLEDIDSQNIRLNTFALGRSPSVVERFYIPTAKVTGISSLNVHRQFGFDKVVGVSVQTANAYIEREGIEGEIAAWIDVEGNADHVLEGFGDRLSELRIALIEVETHDYYNRQPSLHRVLKLLNDANLEVIGRDWMNRGQFNLLVARKGVAPSPALENYRSFLIECVAGFRRKAS